MKNWSLNTKIWSVIAVLSAAFVLNTGMTFVELDGVRDSLNEITDVFFKRYEYANDFEDGQRDVFIATLEVISSPTEEGIKAGKEHFEHAVTGYEKAIEAYRKIASTEEREAAERLNAKFESFVTVAKKAIELDSENKTKEAHDALASTEGIRKEMAAMMEEIHKMTLSQVDVNSDKANNNVRHSMWVSGVLAVTSILLSLFVAFFVLRAVSRAISSIVKELSDSSVQVSEAATQIASSSEELSQASTEQASSLEETAASVEEMNSMISKNSENAKSAEETSEKSQAAVTVGKDIVKRMMESMQQINQSSEGMAETVKVIEQIDKKTKVINEIVNKTELLSFNASVEAARAGEHGKGFAVVAEEVGNLARMSGTAAEEIAVLLEESIKKVNQMVLTTKKSVETGTEVTRECGEVFEDIVGHVSQVSAMATEISSASQEQSRGIGEINKAMGQLDQMTQQNAATSEECAAAAEELSAQAENLRNAITYLVATINGGSGNTQITARTEAAPVKTAFNQTSKQKAVRLKGPRPEAAQAAAVAVKRGAAPEYTSDGFTDV